MGGAWYQQKKSKADAFPLTPTKNVKYADNLVGRSSRTLGIV